MTAGIHRGRHHTLIRAVVTGCRAAGSAAARRVDTAVERLVHTSQVAPTIAAQVRSVRRMSLATIMLHRVCLLMRQ